MSLRGPVDPDHQPVTRFHLSSFLGQPWCPSVPVLALEAQLPTGCPTTTHSAGVQVRKRRLKALGKRWRSRRSGRTRKESHRSALTAASRQRDPQAEGTGKTPPSPGLAVLLESGCEPWRRDRLPEEAMSEGARHAGTFASL